MMVVSVVSGVDGREPHRCHVKVLGFAVVVGILEAGHGVAIPVARTQSHSARREHRRVLPVPEVLKKT